MYIKIYKGAWLTTRGNIYVIVISKNRQF